MKAWTGVLVLGAALALAGCVVPVPSGGARGNATVGDVIAGDDAGLNAFRAGKGLAPLQRSAALQRAAEAHARDMAEKDYFDHVSPSGVTLVQRAKAAGYKPCKLAENIAYGYQTMPRAVQSWVDSPAHAKNMAMPEATGYGLAVSGDKYVMVIGRDGC